MKRFFLYLFMLIVSQYSFGQYNEFPLYDNGLIYSSETMDQLGHIVDSLNLQFKTCDLSHPYYSLEQGMADVIRVPNKKAQKLLVENISLKAYLEAYPDALIEQDIWVIKFRYKNYLKEEVLEYSGLPFGYGEEESLIVDDEPVNDKVNGWIIGKKECRAFYLKNITSTEIPHEYARYVQYVDCMIDTTEQIYFPAAEAQIYQMVTENSEAAQFLEWAEEYPDRPEYPNYESTEKKDFDSLYAIYQTKFQTWEGLRLLNLDRKMATSTIRKDQLTKIRDEALSEGNSDERIEFYVARYLSKADALKMKRSRKVMGGCSMDLSPRYHAMNISTLAAQTTQWDIFLRAHLDVMNDRFERASDGSYAWAGRKTYLRELEELDINAVDLLLGISLRVKNVSNNHYSGSISRIGRALTDAQDKETLEAQILKMINDDQLDPYNRLLFAYLFNNYAYNFDKKKEQKNLLKRLEQNISDWPEFMQQVWASNE